MWPSPPDVPSPRRPAAIQLKAGCHPEGLPSSENPARCWRPPSLCWRWPLVSLLTAAVHDRSESALPGPHSRPTRAPASNRSPLPWTLYSALRATAGFEAWGDWKLSPDKPRACTFSTFSLKLSHFSFLVFVVPFFLLLFNADIFSHFKSPLEQDRTGLESHLLNYVQKKSLSTLVF